MSNRNTDVDYNDLTTALDFAFDQRLKQIYTSLPATIVDYDSATKRATVLPAISLLLTNGENRSRALISNVPIIHPSGGGYVIHFPLEKGDAVLLMFTCRGLTEFKKTFTESPPDLDSILSIKDSVAIPAFGALSVNPAGSGLTIQSESGNTFIEIKKDGAINMTAPSGLAIVGDVTISGDVSTSGSLENNGVDVGSTHTHNGVHGTTSPPN